MKSQAAVAGMLLCAALGHGEEPSRSVAFLTEADRLTAHSGKLVAKVVETDDRTEILSVAAIREAMDLGRLVQYARTPLGTRRLEDSLGQGRLSDLPKVEDFADLRLDAGDLELLSSCRIGDCRVRLTADAISEIPRRSRGTEASGRHELEQAFRVMLAREAAAYLAVGHSGLTAYGDGPSAIHRAEGLSELLRRPLYLLEGADDLVRYLRSFPSTRPRLVDDFLSWRQERFWRKPVIGLYHSMIWETMSEGQRRILVASKQFYASHFYESAVELLEIRKRDRDPEADLTFVSRVRADIRPTGFNWLERTLIRRLVRGRLEDQFEDLVARLAPGREAAETRTGAGGNSRGGTPGGR
jgi:hypothetical protein